MRERERNSNMPDYVSNPLSQVVLLFEVEGWEGVEKHAKANGISLSKQLPSPFERCPPTAQSF